MVMVDDWAPIDKPPLTLRPPHHPYDHCPPEHMSSLCRAELLEVLEGVELGEYDRRIVDWLAGWDTATVATVVSLLHRVRAAGAGDCSHGRSVTADRL